MSTPSSRLPRRPGSPATLASAAQETEQAAMQAATAAGPGLANPLASMFPLADFQQAWLQPWFMSLQGTMQLWQSGLQAVMQAQADWWKLVSEQMAARGDAGARTGS